MQAFNRLIEDLFPSKSTSPGPITETIIRAGNLLGMPEVKEHGFLYQAQVIEELAKRVTQKPAPIKYTKEEGGEWYPWEYRQKPFSVMFEDGSIFDPIAGWRGKT